MRPDRPLPRRCAPGDRALVERLLALARRTRERPMDPELPERVLAALGLTAQRPAVARRNAPRRAAVAVGLLATLALLLLPPGTDATARRAQAPLLSAPMPGLRPVPQHASRATPAPVIERGHPPAAGRLEPTR